MLQYRLDFRRRGVGSGHRHYKNLLGPVVLTRIIPAQDAARVGDNVRGRVGETVKKQTVKNQGMHTCIT